MKKPCGRPRKSPIKSGEKVQIGVRISPEVREQLAKAIAKNGRSLTQEAEIRIERTFHDDEVMAELRAVRGLLERFLVNGGGVR